MVERPGEEDGSNGGATKREGGCPVRSSGGQEDRTSPDGASSHGRAWSIAAWIPFWGGRDDTASDSNGSSSSSSNSSRRSSDNGAMDANNGIAVSSSSSRMEHGGCPVKGSGDNRSGGSSSSGCPVQHDSSSSPAAAPVAPSSGNGLAGLPGKGLAGEGLAGAGAEEGYNALTNEYVYGQEVVPGQEMPLSTSRQRSSIPKADFNPSHQPQVNTVCCCLRRWRHAVRSKMRFLLFV